MKPSPRTGYKRVRIKDLEIAEKHHNPEKSSLNADWKTARNRGPKITGNQVLKQVKKEKNNLGPRNCEKISSRVVYRTIKDHKIARTQVIDVVL